MMWDNEWKNVVDSDENKFNLDKLVGFQRYRRDRRWTQETQYARNFHGGSLTVWAAFVYNKTSPISFTGHKMSTLRYVELLDSVLIDFAETFFSENWSFQQDNAAIHNTAVTKTFFSQINLCVIKWPANCSDLNLKENLREIFSGQIYFGGGQFNSE